MYSDLHHNILVTYFCYIHWDFWIVKKDFMGFASPSVSHTLSHTEHTSSHAFPCSGPVLVPAYFLSWLRAVSFFQSCIYPLGTLTSFEQHFINSISISVPWKICFHCTGITLFYSSVVWFHLTISISKRNLLQRILRVLFDFLSGYNLSQLKDLSQWNNFSQNRAAPPEPSPRAGYSNQLEPALQKPFDKRHWPC